MKKKEKHIKNIEVKEKMEFIFTIAFPFLIIVCFIVYRIINIVNKGWSNEDTLCCLFTFFAAIWCFYTAKIFTKYRVFSDKDIMRLKYEIVLLFDEIYRNPSMFEKFKKIELNQFRTDKLLEFNEIMSKHNKTYIFIEDIDLEKIDEKIAEINNNRIFKIYKACHIREDIAKKNSPKLEEFVLSYKSGEFAKTPKLPIAESLIPLFIGIASLYLTIFEIVKFENELETFFSLLILVLILGFVAFVISWFNPYAKLNYEEYKLNKILNNLKQTQNKKQ